jgi:hypothetical protein
VLLKVKKCYLEPFSRVLLAEKNGAQEAVLKFMDHWEERSKDSQVESTNSKPPLSVLTNKEGGSSPDGHGSLGETEQGQSGTVHQQQEPLFVLTNEKGKAAQKFIDHCIGNEARTSRYSPPIAGLSHLF